MKRRHEVLKDFIDAFKTTFRIIYIPPPIAKVLLRYVIFNNAKKFVNIFQIIWKFQENTSIKYIIVVINLSVNSYFMSVFVHNVTKFKVLYKL